MTRIVGGKAKGRRLTVPGRGTRPTSDRAREALFNSLNGMVDIEGAHVLDLFAGSGALGLEALSRGAASVTFVESDRDACEVIRRNIDVVALDGAQVHRRPASAYLGNTTAEQPFDIVFADPPYAFPEPQLGAVLALLADSGWVTDAAVVVVERSARGIEPRWPDAMHAIKQKRYGEGVLWYGRRK